MDQTQNHDQDWDRREADGQDERARGNPPPSEQQGQSPFLQKIREVQRQGVPEPGAVEPGPLPKPVRSGDFHVDHVPPAEQREER